MTCPPGERPNSGENEDVSIRNSCRASTETKLLVPPMALKACAAPVPDSLMLGVVATTPKFADTPSTVKLFALVLCLAILNCPGEKLLLGAMTTPGVNWSNVLKLRPFNGKLSTKLRSITVLTDASVVLISDGPASTVTLSVTDPISRWKFCSM